MIKIFIHSYTGMENYFNNINNSYSGMNNYFNNSVFEEKKSIPLTSSPSPAPIPTPSLVHLIFKF